MEVDDQNVAEGMEVKSNEDSNNSEEKSSQDDMDIAPANIEELEEENQAEKDESIADNADDEDLRQFDVLDDLEGSESEGGSNDSMDSDIPDDEIEAMLEEGLPDEFKKKLSNRKSELHYEEKEKLILEEIGHNHFDILPEGWVQVITFTCNGMIS